MVAMLIHYMAPIMFASLVIFLLLGYPVAFSLAANGLIFGLLGIELGLFRPDFLQALPERIYGIMNNDVLLAIPFFTFMGLILERSGMAEDLLDTIGQLFGTIRGGLAYAVIFVGALLAATTGVVAASVISMGLISLPIMLRYGYDRRLASGVIAASGTLAQIIPPSLVLIVMADQLGRSVGDMYEGAFLPGLMLAGLYAGYVVLVTLLFPKLAPGLPVEAIEYREDDGGRGLVSLAALFVVSSAVAVFAMRTSTTRGADYVVILMFVGIVFAFCVAVVNWLCNRLFGIRFLSRLAQQVTFVMVPPLFLIFLVLGTIFIGLATPTEGGAMGATGALILALIKRRLTWDLTRQAAEITAKLSAFVVFILIGARVFSLTFYGVDGHRWVEELLVSLPGGRGRLSHLRQCLRFLSRLLSRLLRDRLHRDSPARTGGGAARHRPHLVRRDPRGQHADVVHAPAVRICAVLFALGRAARTVYRPRVRHAHGAGDDGTDLLGRGAVRGDLMHRGGAGHRLSGAGHALQGDGTEGRSFEDRVRNPAARHAAAARSRRVRRNGSERSPRRRLSVVRLPAWPSGAWAEDGARVGSLSARRIDYPVEPVSPPGPAKRHCPKCECDCARGSCRRSIRRPATTDIRRCGRPAWRPRPS